jgi:hypothetical protein
MNSVSNQIMKRIRGKGRGWVFTPKHFVDLGTRASVDMALSRLASTGNIRRVGRGLYDYPVQHDKLGNLTPDPAKVARAISKQSGDKVAVSGASAANRFGLSTQVPTKVSFATSGRSKIKRAAGRSFSLKHSRAPVLDNAPDSANAVLQALAHVGKDNLDNDQIRSFASRVRDKDMRVLRRARAQMPGWMSDAILKIDRERDG